MLINFILALRVGDYSRLGVYSSKFQTYVYNFQKNGQSMADTGTELNFGYSQ